MHKKIGVTGASGFIGKQLVQRLCAEDFDVTIFTRSPQEFPTTVQSITGTFADKQSLKKLINSVDTVIHLAARQIPPDDLLFQSNVTATNKLIECMLEMPQEHLIYLSTAAVYGDQSNKILDETDICKPTTPYGLTKYLGETICQYWQSKTNQTLTILRPFNVYGKGSTKGVIYQMLQSIQNNKPITIYGDGKQTRDFLDIEDLIEGIVLAIKEKKNGIYNLGSGENTSLLELVEYVKKYFPKKVEVLFEEIEKGKPNNISYSLEKAKNELGWKANIGIEEGLKKLMHNE